MITLEEMKESLLEARRRQVLTIAGVRRDRLRMAGRNPSLELLMHMDRQKEQAESAIADLDKALTQINKELAA